MTKDELISRLESGEWLSEELKDEIDREQLENSMSKECSREEWLEERKRGIGGSDAAAILGLTNYKNNVELWEEKTGRLTPKDISDKPCVKYGTDMEPILRESFKIKNPQFIVTHKENTIVRHPKYPFIFASLDGELLEVSTGRNGILEIKTADIKQSTQKEKWKDKIPDNYYCQILHYLNVTGYDFVKLFAELNYEENYQATKTYTIERKDVEEDMKFLLDKEIEFWNYVEKDIRPPLVLPNI